MNERDFCYWLQGMFELQTPAMLNAEQTKLIKEHLELVFRHDTGEAMEATPGTRLPFDINQMMIC